jgi:hypothetical protein
MIPLQAAQPNHSIACVEPINHPIFNVISFIRIEKSSFSRTARLTCPQEAIERTKQGKTEQTKNKKHTPV